MTLVFIIGSVLILASCQSALSIEEDGGWDYVINCACETKPGQTDPVYREGILKLSLNCATEAAKLNVKRFVEVSTGHMCSSNKVCFTNILCFATQPISLISRFKNSTFRQMNFVHW
jgi:nucleoside-diphosphate-sugar epimerase